MNPIPPAPQGMDLRGAALSAEARDVLVLASCPFASLSADLRSALLALMVLREFGAGQHLIRQGDPGDCLLVILSGTAEAFIRHAASRQMKVGEFGPGDVVGEIGPLTGEARTADVVAGTTVRALRLSVADFDRAAAANPEVRLLLTNVVADRLGAATYDGLSGKDIHGYRIVRCVGRGGMGIVYEATRLSSGETVAVKMLKHSLLYHLGAIQRFRQEADALKSLHHESIARLYEYFAAYGTHFLVMEFCAGSTLQELIAGGRPLDERVVRHIVGQLAGALQNVHTHGLIHSDIKPSNVMIGRDGLVKLLDFGLVRTGATWLASSASASTQSVDLKGTLRYMAPEQFNKHDPIDRRVDLYGLACLAYEALSGRPVVDASDLEGIIGQKLGFVLPAPKEIGLGISEEMYTFLAQGLNRHPEQRMIDLEKVARWAGPVGLGC